MVLRGTQWVKCGNGCIRPANPLLPEGQRGDVLFGLTHGPFRRVAPGVFAAFQRRLHGDGYGVYPKLAPQPGNTTLFFRVGHFRRKFVEAKTSIATRPGSSFNCAICTKWNGDRARNGLVLGLREAIQTAEACPIWERMRKALVLWQPRVWRASRLGKALTYGSERWEGLCRYVDDGQAEIDSNLVENAIRPSGN